MDSSSMQHIINEITHLFSHQYRMHNALFGKSIFSTLIYQMLVIGC